jgi:hypothetical protein
VAWLSGVSRRTVALIVAGVLVAFGALGYLLLRAPGAGQSQAVANRRLGSEEHAYHKWVNEFAAGLGDRPAVVILEPDALAQLSSCRAKAQRLARLQMLSYAVKTLQTGSDQVYLDAGHSDWVPAGQMAAQLRAADVGQAFGFALNVSNFDTTTRELGYATALNRDLRMTKRFVIDTSRNGRRSAGPRVHSAVGSFSRALPGSRRGALAGQLYTNPDTLAADWLRTHPGDPRAREIRQRIANQPTAQWFGAWSGDITTAVSTYTIAASRTHKVPVMVAYGIPQLHCGSQGGGHHAGQWCNPPGRQLGPVPQVLDDNGDMGLWIKAPGESDGNCGAGAGTQPGQFSPALARDLITGRQ